MKLYEFYDQYFDGRSNALKKRLLRQQPAAFCAAWASLAVLRQQGGFDEWWGRIKEPKQDEIFDTMIRDIQSLL
jgi:hypothetical protein